MARTQRTTAGLAGLCLLLLNACSGGINTEETVHAPRSELVIVIDSEWAPEQVEQILEGIDVIRPALGAWVKVDVSFGDCDETVLGCLSAVDPDSDVLQSAEDALEAETSTDTEVIGFSGLKAISMNRFNGNLAILTAHELGHRVGGNHEDGGLMDTFLASGTEITPATLHGMHLKGYR